MVHVPIVILDFGSQTTQLIARRVRAANVYCEIHPCTLSFDRIKSMSPRGIILSGGPASVFEDGAPRVDSKVFSLGLPILGICYGCQLLCQESGGVVEKGSSREFGRATLVAREASRLLAPFKDDATVWMSHGDRVEKLPPGFVSMAETQGSPFAVIGDSSRHLYGVQFHPEVVHTPRGGEFLTHFVREICGAKPEWTPESYIEAEVQKIQTAVGTDSALCGLSGGVDSSVAAVLVSKAIGERLTCVFVDNGLLRHREAESVVKMFRDDFRLNVLHVDASKEFLAALEGIVEPEQKRKTIGRVFIEVFEREANRLSPRPKHLVQGTLYPDVIESVSFKGPSAVIKSHHNVGGLPERMNLKLVEPLRELFKDEVREIGVKLGLSEESIRRQPFPGPGLAIRVLGEVSPARLEIVRGADRVLDEEIRAFGLYDKLWQAFAVLLPVRTVGVMGDGRTYDEVIAIRAVEASDGMTADFAHLPHELLSRVSTRIVNEVKGVSRVVYDITSKPPATIEWE